MRAFQQARKMPRAKLKADFRAESVHTVTLFIPALFWPHAGTDYDPPTVPVLRELIGRSDARESPCDDEQSWLCRQFGVPQQADWPSAPIALLGTGLPPGTDFWLSADPVHLQVNRDQLILLAPEALSITSAEAGSLCAALNRHFVTDGFIFVAPHPHRWYLKTAVPARIHTSGLTRAAGQDVDRMLPQGEDRLAWHRIFNEVQMVLHEHPINEERERRGALPINSLWFSGGGILPRACTSFQAVVGSSALARGMSKLTAIPFTATEKGIAANGASAVLIELCDAATASLCLDPVAWKHALEVLEQRWIKPISRMLKKGRIRQIVIATVADGRSYEWTICRTNLWRWWRPAASMVISARNS